MSGFFAALAPAGIFYPVFVALVALGLGLRFSLRRASGADRWDARVQTLERLALTSILLGMLAFAVLQILLRNLFHTGLVWIEPLLRHLVLWAGFTAAVVAAGRLRHIQMDVIGRLLPEAARLWVLRATALAAACVSTVLARAAWIYLGQEREFGSSGFLEIPTWLLTVVIFLGFALMAKRFAARALMSSGELLAILHEAQGEGGRDPADPPPGEDADHAV